MHEIKKLAEAKILFEKLKEEEPNQGIFNAKLSSFVQSARSIFAYAAQEAKDAKNEEMMNWVKKVSKSTPEMIFIDKLRNIIAHRRPVETRKHVSVSIGASVGTKVSISMKVFRNGPEGLFETENIDAQKVTSEIKKPALLTGETKRLHFIDEWTGPEDCLSLCAKYLRQIETFLDEGKKKGFIME